MKPVIEAAEVTKRFGKVQALSGLDLVIESGQVTALLGPNGAGKTTFVRALATLVRPDSGTILVAGYDVRRQPAQVRAAIGLAGQYAAVEGAMTGRGNLELVARLYGYRRAAARARAADVIERLRLGEVADRLVRTYSGGQRRRLDLGASLVATPRLLLLDEPTTGLDPLSRIELWDAIRALADNGTDVLLTTQYLDEADQLAGRIVIIDHGRVIADDSPAQLKRRGGSDVVDIHVNDDGALATAAAAVRNSSGAPPVVDRATRRLALPAPAGADDLVAAANALRESRVDVAEIGLRRPTLDEVFVALTGGSPTR